MAELKEELHKWGMTEYIMPNRTESRNTRAVILEIVGRDGNWHELRCDHFGHEANGAEKNLSALKTAIRGYRLAEQRGIAYLFAEVSKLTALPDPNDPYHILGVTPQAGREALMAAYREKIKRAHPDTGGSREEYDRVRAAGEKLGVV